ncbi:hypothetical protein G3580_14865 [Nitrogeniibacter mangrovi]|uniref:Uncharacterized protein n=2 Tax=Nitrogeniibacter mangrovi TaxID=2016596 RepID=A0A6C1B7Y6_9RHOO|nr:hypothetical protein G3580_14865 [Nitrogeniibacter mangrovi]
MLASLGLPACSMLPRATPPDGHLRSADLPATTRAAATPIPPPVSRSFSLPPPKPVAKAETYSVVVNDVDVRELLFALARDAKVNVDIHPGLSGRVTLNAINQTLPQLLERIAQQVDMRYEQHGPNLEVMPDTPYLHAYKIDYVNMNRTASGTVSTNTQIATNGGGAGTGAQNSAGSNGNISSTRIENTSSNAFWTSIEANIKDLLKETDKVLPAAAVAGKDGESRFREAASVIVNRESGIVNVRATARQHAKVREFIDKVVAAARRQVMIEATIVEVALNDSYQQGIDWSHLGGKTWGISGPSLGTNVGSSLAPFTVSYLSKNLDINVDLLEAFGTVKVLSSPRLAVLNNQTAMLKVVDEFVYFNVKAETVSTANVDSRTTFTTTPQSVSVGMVMSITPQIADTGEVTLNVRPTISSISDLKEDPNPQLAAANIQNLVPQIRTREIESVLRLRSGQIAVLGGLMEDRIDYKTGRIPLVGQIPLFGEAFTERDNAVKKTELVIFLRPVVVDDGFMSPAMARRLPDREFFTRDPVPGTRNFAPRTTPPSQP